MRLGLVNNLIYAAIGKPEITATRVVCVIPLANPRQPISKRRASGASGTAVERSLIRGEAYLD